MCAACGSECKTEHCIIGERRRVQIPAPKWYTPNGSPITASTSDYEFGWHFFDGLRFVLLEARYRVHRVRGPRTVHFPFCNPNTRVAFSRFSRLFILPCALSPPRRRAISLPRRQWGPGGARLWVRIFCKKDLLHSSVKTNATRNLTRVGFVFARFTVHDVWNAAREHQRIQIIQTNETCAWNLRFYYYFCGASVDAV